MDFTTNGVVGETAPGDMDGDSFMIGFSTFQILNEIFGAAGVGLQIDTTLTKFIAQHYKGTNAKEVLNKIKLLEGVHWFEDHVLNQVRIAKEADMVDSTEDLTQGDYDHDWELEDDNNYYSAVEVFGSAGYNIYYKAIDPAYPVTNKSPMTKTIIEETIMTVAEAREMWKGKVLFMNFPSSVHLRKASVIAEITKQILKESAPGNKFIIGITENVPEDRWRESFYTILKTINKFGKLPIDERIF